MVPNKTSGDKFYDKDGYLHREDGPALISNGYVEYRIHGELHREDGPAVIHQNGTEIWYRHGEKHREDGPAFIAKDKNVWYFNGQYHRIDGPAVEYKDGRNPRWCLHGVWITNSKDFKFYSEISDEDLAVLILKYGDFK